MQQHTPQQPITAPTNAMRNGTPFVYNAATAQPFNFHSNNSYGVHHRCRARPPNPLASRGNMGGYEISACCEGKRERIVLPSQQAAADLLEYP